MMGGLQSFVPWGIYSTTSKLLDLCVYRVAWSIPFTLVLLAGSVATPCLLLTAANYVFSFLIGQILCSKSGSQFLADLHGLLVFYNLHSMILYDLFSYLILPDFFNIFFRFSICPQQENASGLPQSPTPEGSPSTLCLFSQGSQHFHNINIFGSLVKPMDSFSEYH